MFQMNLLLLQLVSLNLSMMQNKFEYNFTNENQLIELREKISELQQENALLKQSLEELIKVNTELTESIEEFNSDNLQQEYQNQQIQQMHNTIEELNNELEKLKRENDAYFGQRSKNSKKGETSIMDERETESLVNVLEELIQSFKNMQTRYEQEMQELQTNFQNCKSNFEYTLSKLQENYKQKLNTLEPIILQLHRKDQNLNYIEQRLFELESRRDSFKQQRSSNLHSLQPNSDEVKRLSQALQEKDKIIKFYQLSLERLKLKFTQKL